MKLSTRTALILTLTSLLALGGMASVAGAVLDDAFRDLEANDARRDLERAEAALQADLTALSWTATQMGDLALLLFDGAGDETASMERLNASLGLITSIFLSGEVDALAMGTPGNWSAWTIDPAGFAGGLEGAFRNATPELVDAVVSSSVADTGFLEARSALLQAGGTAYLAGGRGLGTDLGLGGDTFTIVALRAVDEAYVQHLAAVTNLDLEAGATSVDEDFHIERDGFGSWSASTVLPADGVPVLHLQVTGDRDVYQQGVVAFLFVVGGATVISALLLGAGLLALRLTVVGRVHALGQRVAAVRTSGNLGARVGLRGNDELSELSHEFDLMLADLEGRSTDLSRSNQELGAFASVVSHDLKSPLSTFNMNLAIMRRQADRDGDEKQQERIARMERTVQTMQGRIEAVLEYSRAGREPKRVVVPLDDVARSVLEDVEANLVEAGASVDLRPLPSVRGDRQALSQVLQNLIQNAVKYRHPDRPPRIQLRAEEAEDGWFVAVEDNGRGFDPEDAQKMLLPFQRLDNSADQPGHGVGLATCVRIMAAHDGDLRAEGRLDKGATMRLWFPKHRVLAPPTPGRTSLVGGIKKALITEPPKPVAPVREEEEDAGENAEEGGDEPGGAPASGPGPDNEPGEPPAQDPSPGPQEERPVEAAPAAPPHAPPEPAREEPPRTERRHEGERGGPGRPAPDAPAHGDEDWRDELERRFGSQRQASSGAAPADRHGPAGDRSRAADRPRRGQPREGPPVRQGSR